MLDQAPTVYHPYLSGRYTVSAGLYRLGVQPVEGRVEHHTFAFDRSYPAFVASKVQARRRALHEYVAEAALQPRLRRAVLAWLVQAAVHDAGGGLTWDGHTFSNRWLGWAAGLDLEGGSCGPVRHFPAPLAHLVQGVEPLNALDFLAMNVPEDLAIVARTAQGHDYLAAVHVLSPQHWNPLDKVGRNFVTVHAPVAGSGPMNATAPRLLDAVIGRGPFVRFAWGLAMSAWLDHHPNAEPDGDRDGTPDFDPARAYLRVERQTLHGFPVAQGALFTIRPYVYPLAEVLNPERAAALASALRSMTPEQQLYKGMAHTMPAVLAWLDRQAQPLT
ncbi:heme-dependent oxidative N-demethylase subunit alpha family protein [Deinococcus sonorensis]|uniref:Heme-dependent oxidative N-demethylase subunit alpha family protein n=2 Tax=Deinococcus sonorensis TaxID=309891 RepID=A0AAU7UA98_9DEIO